MLNEMVAIVTGGTRGIGFATVKKFLEHGAKVVLFGSKAESVNKAIADLKKENASFVVSGYYPNLTNEEEVKAVFEKIKTEYGRIDILVNNAGISSRTKLTDFTLEEYDQISDLNIKSVFVCSKLITPYLKETKGVILNTSSMVSIHGQQSGVMYPASKFAVNGITKSLARELASFGIRVNAVAPGVIEGNDRTFNSNYSFRPCWKARRYCKCFLVFSKQYGQLHYRSCVICRRCCKKLGK